MTDIVAPSPIAALPPAPQLTDTQADFNSKAFALVGALPGFVTQANAAGVAVQINAIASQERATSSAASSASAAGSATAAAAARDTAQAFAQSAVNAPGTSATSASSLSVGAGYKFLSSQPSKAWVVGQAVVLARTSAPVATRMYGIVDGYDGITGAMTIVVGAGQSVGSGTFSDWTISLTATREGLVSQGVGPGQSANAISMGWANPRVLISVDGSNLGALAMLAEVQMAMPVGSCMMWPGPTPPAGWFKRNGAALSRTTHAALFAVIQTIYGAGDGSTTFNLPDDRALVDRGLDDGRGLDPGRVLGSYQESQNLSHAHGASISAAPAHDHGGQTGSAGAHGHTTNDPGHAHSFTKGAGDTPAGSHANSDNANDAGTQNTSSSTTGITINAAAAHPHAISPDGVHGHTATINPDGGSEARMRNSAKLPIIKYV